MKKIGIIGGTGLENPDIIKGYREIELETPYGKPSSKVKTGIINGAEVFIISRHGAKHEIPPTFVNNRANIKCFKDLGVDYIIATTAVGSLREEIKRGDFVIIDQFIDFTRFRKNTFFEDFSEGIVHCPMAEPFDSYLRSVIIETCKEQQINYHSNGTVITIEGPRFSTKAESKMFRLWGADIINMSTAPECILANELKIPYAAIAMSTDYDCWKEDEESVSYEAVFEIFNKNVDKMKNLLLEVIKKLANS